MRKCANDDRYHEEDKHERTVQCPTLHQNNHGRPKGGPNPEQRSPGVDPPDPNDDEHIHEDILGQVETQKRIDPAREINCVCHRDRLV